METKAPSPRLATLLSRLSEEALTAEESHELEEIIRQDPAAQEYYHWHVAVHVGLVEQGGMLKFEPRNLVRPVFGKRLLATAAVLALCAIPAWLWSQRQGPGMPNSTADQEVVERGPIAAVVSAATGVQWSAEPAAEAGVALHAGELAVNQGSLSLLLPGGQAVFLEGPVKIRLMSPNDIAVLAGKVAFRSEGQSQSTPFVVHLPKGAIVDRGSEFSINVKTGGMADIMAFRQNLVACTLAASGRTREERELTPGQSVGLNGDFVPVAVAANDFLRVPPPPRATNSVSGDSYGTAVKASAPAAYWRFEEEGDGRTVADEMGGSPLMLVENATLTGDPNHRYLFVDAAAASGFAIPRDPSFTFKPQGAFSVELLLYPASEGYGAPFAMELAGPPPSGVEVRSSHAPQYFLMERMGRRGEQILHVYPDFALRSLIRVPAGYAGGINIYSKESYLIHRWIHAVVTVDGSHLRLYIDGQLSDDVPAVRDLSGIAMRPTIGRMQPLSRVDQRQWVGGIDDVALYPRALTKEEVTAHYQKLDRR